MKKVGNTSLYMEEKNMDLMRAFNYAIRTKGSSNMSEVWKKVANTPSSRFWVGCDRASVVMYRIIKGDTLDDMRPLRRDMYMEIYRRAMIMKQKCPKRSLYKIVSLVIESPAPSFYMNPASIKMQVYKIQRAWYKDRLNKIENEKRRMNDNPGNTR